MWKNNAPSQILVESLPVKDMKQKNKPRASICTYTVVWTILHEMGPTDSATHAVQRIAYLVLDITMELTELNKDPWLTITLGTLFTAFANWLLIFMQGKHGGICAGIDALLREMEMFLSNICTVSVRRCIVDKRTMLELATGKAKQQRQQQKTVQLDGTFLFEIHFHRFR